MRRISLGRSNRAKRCHVPSKLLRIACCVMHRQRVQPHAFDEPIDSPQRSPFAGGGHGSDGEEFGAVPVVPRGGACLRCCASLSPTNNLMVGAQQSFVSQWFLRQWCACAVRTRAAPLCGFARCLWSQYRALSLLLLLKLGCQV